MATSTHIQFDTNGFRAILCGGGTKGAVYSAAGKLASGVPGAKARAIIGGYGGGRWVGFVTTNPDTPEAAVVQRELLEAALHGG